MKERTIHAVVLHSNEINDKCSIATHHRPQIPNTKYENSIALEITLQIKIHCKHYKLNGVHSMSVLSSE